ncbi:MFS transporter [Corynebacterium felinum]|uniref:MFS family permease n=1 Tax=Corynebacterium felinum TaxID=131318 RepID=A0ABU2BDQ0_9CORY|nr:MFS transporter [Corynebacterium felinum]MDF5819533.1 MFS transporter [Corynebacterium felinum]MDR7356084.1 MFS family permease [Corynebacterium felinum]WJY95418.1 putative transporter [Corynebacterium felinum]
MNTLRQVNGFIPTLIAVAAAFGSWSLLLPVVPLAVLESGGSAVLAGATTGVFMGATVVTQVFTPRALRRVGYTPVMIFSAVMLGIPALWYLLSVDPVSLLVVAALRGVGFGALTVAQSALIAEIVPMSHLGQATGAMGFTIGFAELVLLPFGVFQAQRWSFESVYVTAACVAMVSALMCAFIPRVIAAQVSASTRTVAWVRLVAPAVAISVVAMGFGAISSFLPGAMEATVAWSAAMLAVLGGAQMLTRYLVGIVADRRGEAGTVLIFALCLSTAGLTLIAVTLVFSLPNILHIVAAGLFGAGFGAVQNEAMLMMFQRVPKERIAHASAVWNMSFDGGTGTGSLGLGVIAVCCGFSSVFFAAGLLIVFGLVIAVADRVRLG